MTTSNTVPSRNGLREKREKAGLSLQEVATALCVDVKALAAIESGAHCEEDLLPRLQQYYDKADQNAAEHIEQDEISRNFLNADHPNLGQLFQDFIDEVTQTPPEKTQD